MITKETLQKFFNGECNAEEANAVKDFVEQNPQFVAEIFSEQEWEAFNPEKAMPDGLSLKLWNQIDNHINRKPFIYYLKKVAVAASIIIGISTIAFFLIFKKPNAESDVIAKKNAIQTIYNNTSKNKLITLSDSSIVWLMPQSSLSYPDSFTTNRRISLSGEAYFEVRKDVAHPFVVSADSIHTTVLGTKFTIQSYTKIANINISLYEGKVLVKKDGLPFKGDKKEYVLLPGDILSFNKQTNEVYVNKKGKNEQPQSSLKPDAITGNSSSTNVITGDNWYMFNNQSLSQVFDQLEILYNTKIDYNKNDVRGMTFIGKIDKTDSLLKILKSIGLLNNLQVLNQPNGYLIKK